MGDPVTVRIKVHSVWEGVPDAALLKAKLARAKDPEAPLMERQEALSYLSGAAKVLAGIEKRQALADHLRHQVKTLRATLYYSGSPDAR